MSLATLDAAVRAALVVALRQASRLAVSELGAAIEKYPVLADVSVGELMGQPPPPPRQTRRPDLVRPEAPPTDPGRRIVSLLQHHRQPVPARALASELGLPVEVVRATLRVLLARSVVQLVGIGRARKYTA